MTVMVRKDASLHEKAVQKVARDELRLPKRRRKPPVAKPEVSTTQVHPALTKMIKDLHIPIGRIEFIGPNVMMIWNQPPKRK